MPEDVEFQTKPRLERALESGVPFVWVTGDEVYGSDRDLRLWLEGVLQDRPQAQRYRKLDDRGEAHLIAPRSWPGAGSGLHSPAPEGHDHWTLRLLAGKVVELGLAPALSHETVRQRLKKTSSSRARSRNGASQR